jgi:hypothetical protein
MNKLFHKAMGALLMNVDGERADESTLRRILQYPQRAGEDFGRWLANDCQLLVNGPKIIKLDPSKKFIPDGYFSAGWTTWKGAKDGGGLEGKEDVDERSLALTEIDLSKVTLETCLKFGEVVINGEEQLARLKTLEGKILLGGNAIMALWEDYQVNGENSGLEWLRITRRVTYIEFHGLILRRFSQRYVPRIQH